jgi:hypothetical protein
MEKSASSSRKLVSVSMFVPISPVSDQRRSTLPTGVIFRNGSAFPHSRSACMI